ncbi:hypothetical protein PROFUN_02700 [Planoprotostelium fungivorum]|uniref:Uncharacterized protein n=1 Tax=Planoprotostelium fungivorum TaxID=1890364 RepID=A0A2P6NVH6_9EUKA|nr:hypothetical protein PROFUN_02700 [Planoprotostelium fungivorum]
MDKDKKTKRPSLKFGTLGSSSSSSTPSTPAASEALTKMIDRKASFFRGISKGQKVVDPQAIGVFGKKLTDIIKQQGHIGGPGSSHMRMGIPIVIQELLSHIQLQGLSEEGLFRIPGDSNEVERLKVLYDTELNNFMINSVAGCVKQYFRELPEPILTFRLYSTFITVNKNANETARKNNLRLMIRKLPDDNKKVFLFLMHHLHEISLHSEVNKMTADNLATCWAPNLLRPEKETTDTLLQDAEAINRIISTIITEVHFMAQGKEEGGVAFDEESGLKELRKSASSLGSFISPSPSSENIVVDVQKESVPVNPHAHYLWMTTQPNNIITHQGYLNYRISNKGWSSAFFVLEGPLLRYYRSETGESLGVVHTGIYNALPLEKSTGHFALFHLTTPHERSWKFQISSAAERTKWLEKINEAQKKYHHQMREYESEVPTTYKELKPKTPAVQRKAEAPVQVQTSTNEEAVN